MKIVGILNITPDSFSDGGEYCSLDKALDQASKMIDEGADIVDIGAESTRPGAVALDAVEEWSRLKAILPEIVGLAHKRNREVSFDSYHLANIKKSLECGIDYINDVTAFADIRIVDLLKKSSVKYILMHNLGVPVSKEVVIAKDKDVVLELKRWFCGKMEYLQRHGVAKDRVIFDLGIGFGKDGEQSLELIQRVNEFSDLGVEIYVGHSRKSFLKDVFQGISEGRDVETAYISSVLMQNNVGYIRVHNVMMNKGLMELSKRF